MRMNVAYHCSNDYTRILAVSLASLFENNKNVEILDVYIIEKNISSENKLSLNHIGQKYNRQIFYIPMPDINKTKNLNLKKVKKKWVFDSYCRLYLDDLLPPHVDKVLYLDSDILVSDSLINLWNTDITNYYAAAAKDCIGKKYYRLFDIKKGEHYCNSGVILFNLNKWRKDKMGDEIKKYVYNNNGYVFFMEQTAINMVLKDKWMILHPRYNVNTLMMLLDYGQIKVLRKMDDFYPAEQVTEAVSHPAIIHMTSSFLVHSRTWIEGSNHPAKALYNQYKLLTPWATENDIPDRRNPVEVIRDKIIDLIPKCILLPFVSFVYNTIRVNSINRYITKYAKN